MIKKILFLNILILVCLFSFNEEALAWSIQREDTTTVSDYSATTRVDTRTDGSFVVSSHFADGSSDYARYDASTNSVVVKSYPPPTDRREGGGNPGGRTPNCYTQNSGAGTNASASNNGNCPSSNRNAPLCRYLRADGKENVLNIDSPDRVRLSWSLKPLFVAEKVTISPRPGRVIFANGSRNVSVNKDTVFELVSTNRFGTSKCSVLVNIDDEEGEVDFCGDYSAINYKKRESCKYANGDESSEVADNLLQPSITANGKSSQVLVRSGSDVDIAWDPKNNTDCSLSKNLSGDAIPSGSEIKVASSETTYAITCGDKSDSVQVLVVPVIEES